jgi:hypothetical protein
LIREEVEPTAAKALLPRKRPETMIFTVLYISCRIPVSTKGAAKTAIFGKSGPLHISSSYFLAVSIGQDIDLSQKIIDPVYHNISLIV